MMSWGIPEVGWRKGPWTHEEDRLLGEYVKLHGEGRWSSVARYTGLNRSGKSCRLRWVNYLRPGLKKGQFTPLEAGIIIEMHAIWGNKWSTIARYLPGRTDNEIKNYWRTHFKKRDKSYKKQEKGKSPILGQNPPSDKESQEQQPQENGMERPTSSADTSCEQMIEAQGREENFSMYPTMEDQCFPMVSQDVASWLDTIKEDDLYSGLWNFDDLGGDMGHLPTGFSYAVDPNCFDDGGYIFVES